MQIEWKPSEKESPYVFRHSAEWAGVKIHRAMVEPGRMLEHATEFHEVSVTLGGYLTTEKNTATGKRIINRVGAGNVCVTPAGQMFGASWDETLDHMGIFFRPEFVAQTAAENFFSPKFEFIEVNVNEDPLIRQLGLTLVSEANSESPAGRLYADSLIQTLTLHLLKNYGSSQKVFSDKINGGLSGYKLRRVKEFIDVKMQEDLSLAEIAEAADLSQYHFARAFRKSTGQTPQHFLMQRRIERAKELLAKDDLPIVEISLQTGFKNQSHFTTLFRKFTKFTPKMWRELKLA